LILSNSEIHDKNMRFNHNLHLPSANFTLVQKGVLYSGSKIYNHLTLNINPLKPELNPICYFQALLGAHHFLHVSRIRVKLLTLR